jgi:hypothetical protein
MASDLLGDRFAVATARCVRPHLPQYGGASGCSLLSVCLVHDQSKQTAISDLLAVHLDRTRQRIGGGTENQAFFCQQGVERRLRPVLQLSQVHSEVWSFPWANCLLVRFPGLNFDDKMAPGR